MNVFEDNQFEIARLFADVACDFAAQPDIDAVSERVAQVTSNVVGCPWVEVARLTDRGSLAFSEPKDDAVRTILRLSAEEHEGVVSEAVTCQTVVTVDDFGAETRWSGYTARVLAETPIRSALCLPLSVGDKDLGAIALFSPEAHFFTDVRSKAAALIADHAAVALVASTSISRVDNLEIALTTNRAIGVAIGVLMARMNVTDAQAFDLLRTTSQHTHVKLREVADYVATTGELPLAKGESAPESPSVASGGSLPDLSHLTNVAQPPSAPSQVTDDPLPAVPAA